MRNWEAMHMHITSNNCHIYVVMSDAVTWSVSVQLASEWEVSEQFRNRQQSVKEKWAMNRLQAGVTVIRSEQKARQQIRHGYGGVDSRWIAKLAKSYKRVYGPKHLWQWNIRKYFMNSCTLILLIVINVVQINLVISCVTDIIITVFIFMILK